jgi:hypothetical protein
MYSAISRSAAFHPVYPDAEWRAPSALPPSSRPVGAWARMPSLILLLAISSMFAASCHRRPQARVFVPPPAPPKPPFVLPPMPQVPEAPDLDAVSDAETPPELVAEIPVLPPPPEPPKRPVVVAAPKPAPPPPTPEPPGPTSPRIGQMFTADQLREYNRALEDSMSRARTVLAVAAGRRLNAQQSEMVDRIRIFMMQAEQARQKDLVTAVSLARRADLLARDLSGSFP